MSLTHKQKIGKLGEDLVCKDLKNKGYTLIERNYWKPWGEIDIVARKQGKLYFIEVKTGQKYELHNKNVIYPVRNKKPRISVISNVTRETQNTEDIVSRETSDNIKQNVAHETGYAPEENLHNWKIKKLFRVIQTYLNEKDPNNNLEWQLDGAIVKLSLKNKQAKIKYIENIILEE